jgi:hypothetical protein
VIAAGLVVGNVATATTASAATTLRADLYRLRMCESGDHYRLNTGNGYYGAYQFSLATWHGLGYNGRPDRARHVTQDAAAKRLHSREGWRAWPSCARAEHLR